MTEGKVPVPPQDSHQTAGLVAANKNGIATEVDQPQGGQIITDSNGTTIQVEPANSQEEVFIPSKVPESFTDEQLNQEKNTNLCEIWKRVGEEPGYDPKRLELMKARLAGKRPEQVKKILNEIKSWHQKRASNVAKHFQTKVVSDSTEQPPPLEDTSIQEVQMNPQLTLLTEHFSMVELKAITDSLDKLDQSPGDKLVPSTLDERKMQVIRNAAIDKSIRILGNQHEFFRNLQNALAENNKYRAATEDWLRSLVPENPSSISDLMQPLIQIQAASEFLDTINKTADATANKTADATVFTKEDLFMIVVINLKARAKEQKSVSETPESAAQLDEMIRDQHGEVITDLKNDEDVDDIKDENKKDENSNVNHAQLEEKRKTFMDRLKKDAAFLGAVSVHLIEQGIYSSDAGRFFEALMGGNARSMLGETSTSMNKFEVKKGYKPIDFNEFKDAIKGTNAIKLAKSIEYVCRKNSDFKSKLNLSPELNETLIKCVQDEEYANQNIARIMDVLVLKMFARDNTSLNDARNLRVGFQEEVAGRLFEKDKVSLSVKCMEKLYELSHIIPSDRWRNFDWGTNLSTPSSGSSTPDVHTEPMQVAA